MHVLHVYHIITVAGPPTVPGLHLNPEPLSLGASTLY